MLKELEADMDPCKQQSIMNSMEEMLSHKDQKTHSYVTKLIQYT